MTSQQRGKLHGIPQPLGVLPDLPQPRGLQCLVQIMKLKKLGIVQIDHCLVITQIDNGERTDTMVDSKII